MTTPPSLPIRVLLVDDHAVMRMGLRLLLEGQPDLLVVGEAATSAEALAAATCVAPDVIVLDLDLGGESAIDSLPALRAAAPRARVLILTGVRDPNLHRQAVLCGAMGLIRKETAAGVLLQAIRKVQAGEVWLEPTMMASILDEIQSASTAPSRDPEAAKIATLTAREREVIALIGEGLRNRDIARRLHISETTVRHYLTVIFAKLEVTDRLELAVYAYRHGLVPLPQ
jgi:DNA-binding NarL/FixJ family response regulator